MENLSWLNEFADLAMVLWGVPLWYLWRKTEANRDEIAKMARRQDVQETNLANLKERFDQSYEETRESIKGIHETLDQLRKDLGRWYREFVQK